MTQAIYSDVFGRLEWDPQLGCWRGGIDWPPGLHTEVAVWHPGEDVVAGLRTAGEGLSWLHYQEEHARRLVAAAMLEVYNDAWRGDEEEIVEDDLLGRLELAWVGFEEDGSLLLSYDAGEMFGGHFI